MNRSDRPWFSVTHISLPFPPRVVCSPISLRIFVSHVTTFFRTPAPPTPDGSFLGGCRETKLYFGKGRRSPLGEEVRFVFYFFWIWILTEDLQIKMRSHPPNTQNQSTLYASVRGPSLRPFGSLMLPAGCKAVCWCGAPKQPIRSIFNLELMPLLLSISVW